MRFVVGFGRFWYDFVIGDDWRVAVGVAGILALGAIAIVAGLGGEWLAPVVGIGLAAVFALPMVWAR